MSLLNAIEKALVAGGPLRLFVDIQCLAIGEPWEDGFMNALQSAKWKNALERLDDKASDVLVIPIFLGELVSSVDGHKMLVPFQDYSAERFPNMVPIHPRSSGTKTIRETMAQIFSMQGIKAADIGVIESWSQKGIHSQIATELIACGYSVWIDNQEMTGNMYERMAEGDSQSRIFVSMISRQYE
ncbi:hypothetical protein HK100_007708, partial [Physocladia obscura]